MQKFTLVFFISTTILALGYTYQKNHQLAELQTVLEKERLISSQSQGKLKIEMDRLRVSLLEAKNSTTQTQVHSLVSDTKIEPKGEAAQLKLSRPEWQAKLSLRKVEERLALSKDERSELEEKFKNGEKLSGIASVVGEERAKKFFDEEESARKAEEEDSTKEELFKLSRVLGLKSEQEPQVVQVLKNARVLLKDRYLALKQQEDLAMELHSEPSSGDELRAVYEKYRVDLESINSAENSILAAQLKGVLSEEQLNKLLEFQATQKVGLQ